MSEIFYVGGKKFKFTDECINLLIRTYTPLLKSYKTAKTAAKKKAVSGLQKELLVIVHVI